MTITEKIFASFLCVIVVGFAAVVVWDLILMSRGEPTISASVRAIAHTYPLVAFVAGLFVGGLAVHFFWNT